MEVKQIINSLAQLEQEMELSEPGQRAYTTYKERLRPPTNSILNPEQGLTAWKVEFKD